MKSKTTAYLLWFFLGILGGHKFYLGKTGIGILYLFTGGLFFIGWIIDLFTLGQQVDQFNSQSPSPQLHEKTGGADPETPQEVAGNQKKGFFNRIAEAKRDAAEYKRVRQENEKEQKEANKKNINLFAQDITEEDLEAAREDLHILPGKVLHLEYGDMNGAVSERDIEIQKIEEKNRDLYILAFCHLSLEFRTFRKSRIISITYEGHPVDDIQEFWNKEPKPTSSAEDLAADALGDQE